MDSGMSLGSKMIWGMLDLALVAAERGHAELPSEVSPQKWSFDLQQAWQDGTPTRCAGKDEKHVLYTFFF